MPKAILRDQKGWHKTMTIPYPLREIRLPLYRKLKNYWEADDITKTSWITTDRTKEMVVFKLTQHGLNDAYYYDEVIYGGASGNVSSSYNESQAGANPVTASEET